MKKGNDTIGKKLTRSEVEDLVEIARNCHNRSRDAGAEAVAQTYLLSLHTTRGDCKMWFDAEIEKFNLIADTHNKDLNEKQERAKKFAEGKLVKNDHLNTEVSDEGLAKVYEEERESLRVIHARTSGERAALKLFSANMRDDSSPYMPIVRYVFNFNKLVHGAMVSRYCLVLEWVHSKFKDTPNLDVEMIKDAIAAAGSFDAVVEIQREAGKTTSEAQKDAEIIRKAIAEEAKGIALGKTPVATIEMQTEKTKDGFVLLLGRVSDFGIAVLGEAETTENEIENAVSKFGKKVDVGDDRSMEFMGRVIDIANVIKDKQEIMGGADGKQKISSDRMFSLRADNDGSPHLVVSVNHADSGPVFYAKPKDLDILNIDKGPCVMFGSVRRRMEKELDDTIRRRFLTLKVNTNPKQVDGSPATSLISWALHNRALAKAQRTTADQRFYWSALSNIAAKPLDIDNFKPLFEFPLAQEEIHEIFLKLLKPWKGAKNSQKANRVFTIKIEDQEMTLICGDADPLVMGSKVHCHEKISMNFRIADLHALLDVLCKKHFRDYSLSGDPAGLMRLIWQDDYADYSFHQPTVGIDGKLQSRRVAHMTSSAVLLAAE